MKAHQNSELQGIEQKRKSVLQMPWNPAQHRLFEAAAHSPAVAKRVGIPQAKAAGMASEGIKSSTKPKLVGALLGKR